MCLKNANFSFISAWSKRRTLEFNLLRSTWLISLIAALIFSYPPQIIELYRIIAESDSYQIRIAAVALFSLIFMVVSIVTTDYFIARQIVLEKYKNSVSEKVARAMACLLVLVPALAILIGEIRALAIPIGPYNQLADVPPEIQAIYEKISDRLHAAVLLQTLILGLSAFAAFNVLIRNKVAYADVIANRPARYAGIGLVAIFFISQYFYISVSITIGTLNVLMIFLAVLLLVMSSLCYVFDRYYVPAISLLVVWALLLSIAGINNNHEIRKLDRPKSETPVLSSLGDVEQLLKEWLLSRKDYGYITAQGKKYPVFLIAAAGGGSYAAYFTATVLARLQDSCPNFAQHVFAISSVSGGSLGASVFAALSKEYGLNYEHVACIVSTDGPGRLEQAAQKVTSQDFLAPVVWSALFHDSLQRFLPIPVKELDRGKALDFGFESAWRKNNPESPDIFSGGMFNLWSATGSAPMLFLNTTSVVSGQTYTFTPFDGGVLSIMDYDVPLSAAVSASARFPWITPEVVLSLPKKTKNAKAFEIRLVDGGYADNYGIRTILELEPGLEQMFAKYNAELYLISISAGIEFSEFGRMFGPDEIVAPIEAMLAARSQQSAPYLEKADQLFHDRHLAYTLDTFKYPIPLGWTLSDFARTLIARNAGTIDSSSGSYAECSRGAIDRHNNQEVRITEATCASNAIRDVIMGNK